MKTLISLFLTCLTVMGATQQGVSFDPSTKTVTQTGLTQTFKTVTATNEINVGSTGQTPTATLTSANSIPLVITVDTNGTFIIKFGTTNMLTVLVGSNANNDGSSNKFLTAAGYYTNAGGFNQTQFYLPVLGTNEWFDSPIHVFSTNATYQGLNGAEGYTLQFTDANRSAYTVFGADGSSINIASGSSSISITGSPVGGTTNGFVMQPTLADGDVPYVYSTLNDMITTNIVQWQNHGTNFVAFHPGNIASTNTPIFINVNGTFYQVHVGANDSGGTGLRALTIEN